jgi:outer membrane protein assembly factor BamB
LTVLAADGNDVFAGTNIGTIRRYDPAHPVMARQQLVAWDFPQLFPQPVWTARMWHKVVGLALIQETLAAGCTDGFVTGLDARTGNALWHDDTGEEVLRLRGVGAPAAAAHVMAVHGDRSFHYGAETPEPARSGAGRQHELVRFLRDAIRSPGASSTTHCTTTTAA